jgi:hypothetical protein
MVCIGKLALDIVMDFLGQLGFEYTANVLEAEAAAYARSTSRSKVAGRLGMDVDDQEPLLIKYLAAKRCETGNTTEGLNPISMPSYQHAEKSESQPEELCESFVNPADQFEHQPVEQFESFSSPVDQFESQPVEQFESTPAIQFDSADSHNDDHFEKFRKEMIYEEDIPGTESEMSETLDKVEPPIELCESSYTTSEMTVSPGGSIADGLDYFENVDEL